MELSLGFSKFMLVAIAAAGYAVATFCMKHAAVTGALSSVGYAMVIFQLVVIAEVLLLRDMDLSNAYLLIMGVETLMIISVALFFGESFTWREIAGGAMVLGGLLLVGK